jgi:peptidoglycan/LPS O-acetylase OafA/YrhL
MNPDRLHSIGYMPALDGLRAVSILLVVLSHLGLGHIVPGGLGVTIFFFISGFIITHILLRENAKQGVVSLKGFYIKRFFRLGPALLLYVLVSVAFFALVGKPLLLVDIAAAVLYWANYHRIFHGWSTETVWPPLSIIWSLAVEEHFYFAFPLLLVALRRRLGLLLALLVASCASVLAWRLHLVLGVGLEHLAPARTYEATDTRIDSIVFGCVLSVLIARAAVRGPVAADALLRRLGSPAALLVGAALMLASLAYRNEAFRETWRYSLQGIALMPLFVHLFVLERRDALQRLLASPPMVFVGKISYSLYLHHWLALCALAQLMGIGPDAVVVVRLAAVPLMLMLALASYHLVETPLRRYGHRLAERFQADLRNGQRAAQADPSH